MRNWFNVVENKQDCIARVQVVVSRLHNCGAVWPENVPVHETFRGRTVWQGQVELFDLNGQPKAKCAYGRSHRDGADDQGERFVTVLEVPPVESALTAVPVGLVADGKKGEK